MIKPGIGILSKKPLLKALSLACIIHCIITPFMVLWLPFVGHYFESVWIEVILLALSISCGVGIIYQGFCQHKKSHAVGLFIIGVGFWSVHVLLEHIYHIHAEPMLLGVGTVCVLLSYYLNHHQLRSCSRPCCESS